jgi:DNA-binding MarR family transcriptional regulator
MTIEEELLQKAGEKVIDTLPGVWDRIRSNLRAAAISNFGITLEQFHILRHIRMGYASVAELAEKKGISRSAVSQAVEALVGKGLVTRQINPEDRRTARLTLTPYASEVMDANSLKNHIWVKEKMAALPADELRQILAAMEVLRKTFNPEERSH